MRTSRMKEILKETYPGVIKRKIQDRVTRFKRAEIDWLILAR
jgi:hypothetical protein